MNENQTMQKNFDDSFLNLLKNKLDNYQNEALHAVKNSVIAAGAGSGKTQVLATRFAWLVMTRQASVDQILTLTFTNKAAAQMYQRIYETLNFFANHPADARITSEQKQLAQQALDNFSYAHVQTLDSYCASIVRQCANRYGIKPDFTAGSSESFRTIKDKAFIFILQNAQNPAIQALVKPGMLQDYAENTFANIIIQYTSLASPEGFFEAKFNEQVKFIADEWNRLILGNNPASLSAFFSAIIDECNLSLSDPAAKLKDENLKYIEKVKHVYELFCHFQSAQAQHPLLPENIQSQSHDLFVSIQNLEELFNEVTVVHKLTGGKSNIKKAVSVLHNTEETFESLCSFIKQYKVLLEFNRLLDQFLILINNEKRISGNLTFNDISAMTLKILLENQDIRNQEKHAYKKIMIDEFQDNNGKNRDLLYVLALKEGEFEDDDNAVIPLEPLGQDEKKLALHSILVLDEEKLFFVGDEKQSIYKFRGAEVSVFNELSLENQTLQMNYNYRSTPEIVKAFNLFFKNGNGIFCNHDKENRKDYEAYYDKPAEKKDIELPPLTKQNCPIHIMGIYKAELDANDELLPDHEQLGLAIAKKIRELGDSGTQWDNIAILERGRTHRSSLTKYLNRFGIPYELDSQNDIFGDAVINDIYNFLRLCVYPSDKNAFAAWLCSPFAGLSIEGVQTILALTVDDKANDEQFFNASLSECKNLQQLKDILSKQEYNKFICAMSFFDQNRNMVLRQRLTTTLSQLWHNRGYKYETMLSLETSLCAEHFDMLFELARQADEGGYSVAWFIDQLALLRQKFSVQNADLDAAEVSYPLERKHAVKIMTIHKSKGLEFEHVFVTGCTQFNPKTKDSTYFFDQNFGLTFKVESASNYFLLRNKSLQIDMEIAEFRRLIYVAITRAKKSVYLACSFENPKKSESNSRLIENMILKYYPEPLSQNEFPFFEEAGFDYIPVKPVTYSEAAHTTHTGGETEGPLLSSLCNSLIEKAQTQYVKATKIVYECNPVPRLTPSALETSFSSPDLQKNIQASEAFDSDTGLKYEQSDDTLQDAEFTAADFGTLVHSYLEMQAKGIKPEDYKPEPKLFKKLDEKEKQNNMQLCITMCQEFLQSDCGKQFEACKNTGGFYRAEWAFRMFLNGTIFAGSIDLIYQNQDGTYTIVDYKSDSEVSKERYVEQQQCYKIAASKLLKVDQSQITNFLYFLRHKEIVKL